MKRKLLVVALLIALPIVWAVSLALKPPDASADSDDPLVVLNTTFREAYKRGRAETLTRVDPVILVEGDNIVLRRGKDRTEVPFTPAIYHRLKAVSHIPLAIHVLLAPFGDGPISDTRLTEIRKYRDRIPPVRDVLDKQEFSPAQLSRQQQIIAESLAFLDRVLERKQVKHADVTAFTRKMAPLVLENAAEAARAQIDGLHAKVSEWRKQMGPDEWKKLRVVVMGSHMPREGNLAMQYFAHVMGGITDDRRLVYTESVWDEAKASDILGTCVLDTSIGEDFFDDPLRMHRDLLADATTAYLKQLKPEP